MKRLRIMLVGASQMWRLGEELMRKDGVDVMGCVLMEAENTERRNTEMLRELDKKKGEVDSGHWRTDKQFGKTREGGLKRVRRRETGEGKQKRRRTGRVEGDIPLDRSG